MDTLDSILAISYIVPVYNGERYLYDCLDSLRNQGLDDSQYEIICIDDCSKDNSVALLEQYAARYSNVHLILHETNKRTSTSCNEGLGDAKGKYIWVVGQDDWIEQGSAKRLIDIAENDQLDVLPFNYNRINATGTETLFQEEVFKDSEILDGEEYVKSYFYDSTGEFLAGYEWRAIYRRQYLHDKCIAFPKNMIFEDTTFLLKAIWYASRIRSVNEFIYNYRLNDTSITDSVQRYKGYLTYEFSFKTSAELLAFIDDVKEEHIAEELRYSALKSLKSFAYKVIPMVWKEKKIFYDYVQRDWNEIKSLIGMMPISYRILANPKCGIYIAAMYKPIFMLKHLIVKRTYINQ